MIRIDHIWLGVEPVDSKRPPNAPLTFNSAASSDVAAALQSCFGAVLAGA